MSGRHPGLSGLVRLRNEAAWCRLALDSFVAWCDELVVVTNRCDDATPAIVAEFAAQHPAKVRIYEYPHAIWPMGPGHDAIPADDPRSSAAFYNFTQDRATRTHAVKLDGDMVMMDWAGGEIRRLMAAGHDRIRFHGTDIVGAALAHIGCQPLCRTNGVYRITGQTRYAQGPVTQNLRGIQGVPAVEIDRPAFLHFKWARKPFAAATMQWPENWQAIDHFRRIAVRRFPVARYDGEYPASVAALLAAEAA